MRLRFAAPAAAACLIEASTNLVRWEVIGVATPGAAGEFEFEDPRAPAFERRYYRARASTGP
jgi:hypothetical protein